MGGPRRRGPGRAGRGGGRGRCGRRPARAGDVGDGEFSPRSVVSFSERVDDALAAAGGVGSSSVRPSRRWRAVLVVMWCAPVQVGCRGWRVRGMPSMALRWRRTTVTARSMLVRCSG